MGKLQDYNVKKVFYAELWIYMVGVNVRESILLTDIVCTSFQSCGITNMKRSHQTDYEDKSHQNNEKIMMIIKLFKA